MVKHLFRLFTHFPGMKSQFRTAPSIEVRSKGEIKFPNSFRSYNFQSHAGELRNLFTQNGLRIGIVHKERKKTDDLCFGFALINM
jgi:hypothetical protein